MLSKFRNQFDCWKALPPLRSSFQVHSEGVCFIEPEEKSRERPGWFCWARLESHAFTFSGLIQLGDGGESSLYVLEEETTDFGVCNNL